MLKKIFFIVMITATAGFIAGCDGSSSGSDTIPFLLTEVSTIGSIGGLSIDYIELYNSTDEDIDLTGYYFGDSEYETEDESETIEDYCHVIPSTFSVNEWDTTTVTGTEITGSWVEGTTVNEEAAIIPAGGYLIILFTNDLAIDNAVSKTLLPASWNEFEDDGTGITENTVDADFSGNTYLTIPEGLKNSKAEGVYIYKPGESMATTFSPMKQMNRTLMV